ncbi:AraC family transcriptional regulator [Cohnella sp. WQ 127256]|uniref:AraC family transcriptional regulator n=1 Tax=Cohnella sp. WQ 127256 TaxID=2938790 RepID=UPI00211899C6|nr:AraC family transcriptional regulator [Cohnella sp. WQ 127256]
MNKTKGKPASLFYSDTREVLLPGLMAYKASSSLYDRFGTCQQSDLRVSLLDGEEQWIDITAGELFYIPQGYSFKIESLTSTNSTAVFISFRAEFASRSSSLIDPFVLRSFRVPQMKNWISEFINYEQEHLQVDYYRIQSRLYALASAAMKSSHSATSIPADLTRVVEQARQTILNKFDTSLDMEQLAKSSGVGSSRFYRAFRKYTGLSPLKYLITTRLNASLRLLADPNVNVTEAAHSVGYLDEYYFSRLFKKQMGVTPTEYASRAQVSIASLSPIFAGDLTVLGLTPRVSLERDWDLELDNKELYIQEIRLSQPDFILTGPISEALQGELRQIAPLFVYHWHDYSWKSRLIQFGKLFGLDTVAERWLADFERKTANARLQVEELWPQAPYLIIGVRPGNFRTYGKQRRKFTDLLYDELGFNAPPVAAEIGFMDTATIEGVTELDSDNALFLIEFSASDAYYEQLEQQWKSANQGAGRERHCIFIRLEQPFLYHSAMHERLVDQLVSQLHTEDFSKQESPC